MGVLAHLATDCLKHALIAINITVIFRPYPNSRFIFSLDWDDTTRNFPRTVYTWLGLVEGHSPACDLIYEADVVFSRTPSTSPTLPQKICL